MWNSWKTGGFSWVSHWDTPICLDLKCFSLISSLLNSSLGDSVRSRWPWSSWSRGFGGYRYEVIELQHDASPTHLLMLTTCQRFVFWCSLWPTGQVGALTDVAMIYYYLMKWRCGVHASLNLSTLSTVAQLGGTAEVGLQNDLQRLFMTFSEWLYIREFCSFIIQSEFIK